MAGGCCVTLGVLAVAGLVAALGAPHRPAGGEGAGAVAFVLGLLAALLAFLAWRLLRSPYGRKTAFQWDLLRQGLNLKTLPEKDGIQWAMLAFPDSIQAPGHLVLAFLVQNCTSAPRIVSLKLAVHNPPVAACDHRFTLSGGQAGVYRIPFLFPSGMSAGPVPVDFTVEAEARAGKGIRVIEVQGVAVRAGPPFRQVVIEVLPGGAGATLNEFARTWSGLQPIFETGWPRPDLGPLRLLEELRPSS